MTPIDSLIKAGVKAAVISIDLTEPNPVYRVALSKDGADCDGLRGSALNLDVALLRALNSGEFK